MLESPLSDHVEAVLREALSNVVRHAKAITVSIELIVRDEASIDVTDDGSGFAPETTRRSGLGNLAARAAEMGGTFTITPLAQGGTTMHWSAPLP
ncbi:sensor histidine kinase [Nocardia fluminea]|uniref:sensor histidine kinase n=1 Tax=Nocardia fluminea TaxID=134984 RepID=UPI00381CB633